jgi:chemotaxis protein MotB
MNRRAHKGYVSQERWLVSYADFITLLFAFFVVLYASSQADKKKQTMVSASIESAFRALGLFADAKRRPDTASNAGQGTEAPAMPMNIVMGEDVLAPAKVKEDLEHIRQDLEQTLSNQVAQHTVSIQMGRDGLVISLREAGFFNSGSATPRPETLDTLRQIAASLGRTPYDLRIEGHTDNIPIHNDEFDSNWELSAARATHIARIFLELKAMPASVSPPLDTPSSTPLPATTLWTDAPRIAASIWWFCRAAESTSPPPRCQSQPAHGARSRMAIERS